MKNQLSAAALCALLIAAPMASAEDIAEGSIVAIDRKAKVMVLSDRSAWALELSKSEVPGGLKAGDRVQIRYDSDEEGVSAINSISKLMPEKPKEGAPDIAEGKVLAYDRKAKTLVLSDRTVWALEALKSNLPGSIKAGDSVRIEYESDEEGVSAINSIEITGN